MACFKVKGSLYLPCCGLTLTEASKDNDDYLLIEGQRVPSLNLKEEEKKKTKKQSKGSHRWLTGCMLSYPGVIKMLTYLFEKYIKQEKLPRALPARRGPSG